MASMGVTKECNLCGQVKPVGEFSKRRASADRLDPRCKACRKSEKASYYSALRSRSLEELGAARPDSKRCIDCGQTKAGTLFPSDRNKPDGLHNRCRACAAEMTAVWRAAQDPDSLRLQRQISHRKNYARTTRPYKLLKQFGLTQGQYDAMLASQDGRCAICRRPETSTGRYGEIKSLAVDHDWSCCPGVRSCGKCVRELLCQRCNQGTGQFDHDSARLRAAADYLEKHTWQKPLAHTA